MLLFQLPPREINFKSELANVKFPCDVTIRITLAPAEYFGIGSFTTGMREFPTGGAPALDMKVHGTLYGGTGRPTSSVPVSFERFNFDGFFTEISVTINGNVAMLRFRCADMDTIRATISDLIDRFAASFSVCTTVPISISSIDGTAGSTEFDVRFRGLAPGGSPFLISNDIHTKLQAYLAEVLPTIHEWPIQIVSATRYLSQSFLLESVSKHSYYFTGERILNVCKAVESLTLEGGPNIDHMRTFLGSWGVKSRYIEIFVSIRHLRSKLDSAHITYSPLSANAYQKVEEFLPIAERCTQLLILTAIRQVKKNPNTYKAPSLSDEDPPVVERLAKYHDINLENGDLTAI